MTRSALLAALLLGAAGPQLAAQAWPGRTAAPDEHCVPATGDAAAWLRRADSATGLAGLNGRIVAYSASDSRVLMEQSDRTYPPFLSMTQEENRWFDPASGIERWQPASTAGPPRALVGNAGGIGIVTDSGVTPANPILAGFLTPSRALNPLAVLADFHRAPRVVVKARCTFRDYPRIVLERPDTRERLYLDTKSGMPLKLEREEPQYLWGQVRVEYIYTTWTDAGAVSLPFTTVRTIDGIEERRRSLTVGSSFGSAIPRDSAPPMPAPPTLAAAPRGELPAYYPPSPVDTIRVGPSTYLLKAFGYTHAVSLARDTVFLFDATTGEWRSRADSAWIARLFGAHPMVLVVTDLAWPHISGVRFWAARGATIVTHALSRPFLEEVLARRWTRTPDALEQGRSGARPAIRTLRDRLDLAGGAVRLSVIDGPASEGALIAELPGDRFLWASDYIQQVRSSSVYLRETHQAAVRAGFRPTRTAAEHLPVTPWATIDSLAAER